MGESYCLWIKMLKERKRKSLGFTMVVMRCLANWEVRQNTIHARWLSLPIPSINSGDPKTPSGSVIRQTGRTHRIHWQLLYLWLQSATEKGYRLKFVKGRSTGVESGRSTSVLVYKHGLSPTMKFVWSREFYWGSFTYHNLIDLFTTSWV